MYQQITLDKSNHKGFTVGTFMELLMAKHRAKRMDPGEYEYRGFVIFDTGGGRSGHDRMNRHSRFRWRVVRKTGPGYFDREPTNYDGFTLGDAKRRIDSALEPA